jgi:hypothetical protein
VKLILFLVDVLPRMEFCVAVRLRVYVDKGCSLLCILVRRKM